MLLLSYISSISSSISREFRLTLRFLSDFAVNASALALSITSRISCVLKTNLPLIATRFPFLRSLRCRNSSRYSVFSSRKSTFSVYVFLKAALARLIYRRTGL